MSAPPHPLRGLAIGLVLGLTFTPACGDEAGNPVPDAGPDVNRSDGGGQAPDVGGGPSETGGPPDAGGGMGGGDGGYTPGKIACGAASCETATQVCCLSLSAPTPLSCAAKGAMCAGSAHECDDKADCTAGQACCSKAPPGGGGPPTQLCKVAAECRSSGDQVNCRSGADCPSDTPRCCPQSIMGMTFYFCAASGC